MKTRPLNIYNILLSIAAITLAALAARDFLISRYSARQKTVSPKNIQATAEPKARIDFMDYSLIVENGLYGQPGKLTLIDTSPESGTDKPAASAGISSVSLLGTIVGSARNKSYAILEEVKSRKQELFKIDEQVFDAGTLTGVERDRIFIDINGVKTPVGMPIESISGAKTTPGHESLLTQRSGTPDLTPVISRKVGDREWVIDQRMLNKTLEDMGKVLTDARLLPYKEGDKIIGFRVSEVKPDGVFSLVGLKNGDILLKVNNYPIDAPEKGVQLLTGLRGESNISLDVIRDGQKINMNYQIR